MSRQQPGGENRAGRWGRPPALSATEHLRRWRIRRAAITGLALALGLSATAGAGWQEGREAFERGDYERATTEFEGVVADLPGWPGGHLMLGRAYLELGRPLDAIPGLRKATDLEPDNPTHKLLLGRAYLAAKGYSEAVRELNAVAPGSLSSGDQKEAWADLSSAAHLGLGDRAGALEAYRTALAASADRPRLWYKYGLTAFKSEDFAASVEALTRTVELESGNDAARRLLAKALLEHGRTTEAEDARLALYARAATEAARLAGDDASREDRLLLGECQLAARAYDAAIETFTELTTEEKSDWRSYYYLGSTLGTKGEYEASEAPLRTALEATESEEHQRLVWGKLAYAFEKQADFDQAIAAYGSAADSAGVERVERNREIHRHNRLIDDETERATILAREKCEIETRLSEMTGAPPPKCEESGPQDETKRRSGQSR